MPPVYWPEFPPPPGGQGPYPRFPWRRPGLDYGNPNANRLTSLI
jgi:hypothetical protein